MSDPSRAQTPAKPIRQTPLLTAGASSSLSRQHRSDSSNPAIAATVALPPQQGQPPQDRKVAIPRLRRESQPYSAASASAADKSRVAHACEPCRSRKTKCSGDRPACKHCVENGLSCFYSDGKRDKMKKQVGTLAGRLHELENLLRDLYLNANDRDRERIQQALAQDAAFEDDDPDAVSSPSQSSSRSTAIPGPVPYGEHVVSARMGSTEDLDKIDEDFNRTGDVQATGFHGKMSELSWIQRLMAHASNDRDETAEETEQPAFFLDPSTASTSVSDVTYHCDDLDVLLPEQVDLFELPPREVADALFNDYLRFIHPLFPIIGKNTFSNQYLGVFNEGRNPATNWRAILNLIFAIAARHAHLVKAPWRGNEQDHLVYFMRAKGLGLSGDSLFVHANMQRVQITGLMAFYLLAIHQTNRSWTMSGIAARHAISLGLHLRNDAEGVSDSSKEIRYRVWWAISSVERVLTVMTGRTASFSETDCTIPEPLPLEENQLFGEANLQVIQSLRRWSTKDLDLTCRGRGSPTRSPSEPHSKLSPMKSRSPTSVSPSKEQKPELPPSEALFFYHHTKLGVITGDVLRRLYRAPSMQDSWSQTLRKIQNLGDKVKNWISRLPNIFDFTIAEQRDKVWVRERVSLGLFYYSTIILANRPCLCLVDRHIPNESGEAKQINRLNAVTCVDAALQMLRLLPDEPDIVALYTLSPWWCTIHHIVQAATVLLLELAYHAEHMPDRAGEIFLSSKKAWNWLHEMGKEDIAADRAWRLCDEMIRKVAPKIGKSFNEPSPADVFLDSASIVDDFNVELDLPQTMHRYSAPMQDLPPVFSYDQYLTREGLRTTAYRTEIGDNSAIADEMDPIGYGIHETGGYYGSQSPGADPGW